jgi:hypothetical protein
MAAQSRGSVKVLVQPTGVPTGSFGVLARLSLVARGVPYLRGGR